MSIKEIKTYIEVFKPTTVYLSDGFSIKIPHEDYIYFPPNSNSFVVARISGGITLIDSNQVTRMEHSYE